MKQADRRLAMAELGEAVAKRVHGCAAEAQRLLDGYPWDGKAPSADFHASREVTLLVANMLVVRWMITGQAIDDSDRAWLAIRGTEAAKEELAIVNITRSYFAWRDVLSKCIVDEADKLGTPEHVLATALAAVRDSTDASIVRMARAYDAEANRLREALRRQREEFRYQALHDALTDIPNRMLFVDRLEQAILQGRRDRAMVALLMIDLDRFKQVNDQFGHDAGDAVLRTLAQKLFSGFRGSDTVARFGGDEFAMVMPRCRDEASGLRAAEKVVGLLLEPVAVGDAEVTVGGSVGLAFFPSDAENGDDLLRAADVAMYDAKRRAGKPGLTPRQKVSLAGSRG